MREKLRILNAKLKIKQQIRLISLLAILIPVWILGTFSIMQVRKQMLEHYTSQVHADSIRVNSTLFDITTTIYTSSEPLINSTNNMELFGSRYNEAKYYDSYDSISSSLSHLHKDIAAISSVYIYTNNPNIPTSSYIKYMSDYSEESWYNNLPDGVLNNWELVEYQNRFNNDTFELCLVRKMWVVNSSNYSAYLVICLDNNNLKNRLNQNSFNVMASLDDSNIFYSSNLNKINTPLSFPDDFEGGFFNYTGSLSMNGENTLVDIVTYQAYKTNNKFYICVSDDTAYSSINKMTMMYLIIVLLLSLVPTIIILKFSAYFSNRIATLKYAMHQASQGDYNIIDTFKGNDDELAETFKDLKTTVNLIHDKESLYYEHLITEQRLINKQQQMEFNMLASQINPHFLYNTLETIRVQALSCNNKDVVSSINLLGKSMHYVLENTGTNSTTLDKELDHIKTYLAIQHLRFGDRVNSVFNIDPKCNLESIRILPLLLQPLVENSILHGLEAIEGKGYVLISIDTKDQMLNIVIEDNGIGMDAKTLETVRSNIITHESNAHSIGLYNINQRIKLFYGEECNILIDSTEGEGTAITLNLPKPIYNV